MTTAAPDRLTDHLEDFVEAACALGELEDSPLAERMIRVSRLVEDRLDDDSALSIAVVGESARGPESWRDRLLAILPREASMAVAPLSREGLDPRGHDAWLLIVAADQLASLLEKQFVERLPDEMAAHLVVLITRLELIPSSEVGEIMDYARAIFAERGVPERQILGLSGEEEQALEGVWEIMVEWAERAEELRAANLQGMLREVVEPIEDRHDALLAFVRKTPDVELCEADEKFLKDSLQAIEDLLNLHAEELHERLARRYADALATRWKETLGSGTPQERVTVVVQAMNRWLRHELYEALDEEMAATLDEVHARVASQSHLITEVQRIKPWVNAHIEAQINLDEIEPLLDDEGFQPWRVLLRVSLPVGGALIGAAMPFNRLISAATGAGVGVVSSEVIIRLTRRAGDIDVPLDDEVTSEFEALSARAIRLTRERLYALAQEELMQLHTRTLDAQDIRHERDVALAELEALGALRDALQGALRAPAVALEAGEEE